ncbi:hypothetical protein OG871_40160 (plasmid) [Kitasatospora sp. NBC_00374]|uniref:hypothetical protein n=1 Tax=Kitasatospora sp. NBC_00374 TaxID=2975964 RepID=UPI002F91B01F
MTATPPLADAPSQAGVGPLWAEAFLGAVAAAVGSHRTRLEATRKMPHTAYTGQLDTSRPGQLLCSVTLPGAPKARTTIVVGALTETQWDEVAAALPAHPGILGAVQTGRVHLGLLEPKHTAGHPLLPTEFSFDCTAHPAAAAGPGGFFCQHAAVLAHALASRIRQQPAALLTLRGCSQGRLQAKVRTARLSAGAPRPRPAVAAPAPTAADKLVPHPSSGTTREPEMVPPPGSVPAALLFQQWQPAPTGGYEAALPTAPVLPPPVPGVSPALDTIVADAAARARAALSSRTIEVGLTPLTDAIRHLATPQGARLADDVAERLGRTPAEVRRLVVAHRHGGPAGVQAADSLAEADPESVAAAAAAITAAQPTARGSLTAEGNALTAGGAQVRLGHDGRWHPFVAIHGGSWQPVAGASAEPATAFRAARTARLAAPR